MKLDRFSVERLKLAGTKIIVYDSNKFLLIFADSHKLDCALLGFPLGDLSNMLHMFVVIPNLTLLEDINNHLLLPKIGYLNSLAVHLHILHSALFLGADRLRFQNLVGG